jgi:hypothetical protein
MVETGRVLGVKVKVVRREVQEVYQAEIRLWNEESRIGELRQTVMSLSHLWYSFISLALMNGE